MATKIARKTQLQFAGNLSATPTGSLAVFGSQAAGSPAYSSDPAVIQSLSQYLGGWAAAVLGNNAPAKQDRNSLDYLLTYQLGYLLQQGMAEYDSATTYFQYSMCQVAGVLYQCVNPALTGVTGVNPVTDGGANWVTYSSLIAPNPQSVARAWVNFNGGTGAINASYNVSSVTSLGTGNFLITFATPMSDANYLVQTSTSNDLNVPYDPFGRWNGDTKTTTQLQVRNLQGNNYSAWGGNVENYVSVFR